MTRGALRGEIRSGRAIGTGVRMSCQPHDPGPGMRTRAVERPCTWDAPSGRAPLWMRHMAHGQKLEGLEVFLPETTSTGDGPEKQARWAAQLRTAIGASVEKGKAQEMQKGRHHSQDLRRSTKTQFALWDRPFREAVQFTSQTHTQRTRTPNPAATSIHPIAHIRHTAPYLTPW